jgi:hypothetical protein
MSGDSTNDQNGTLLWLEDLITIRWHNTTTKAHFLASTPKNSKMQKHNNFIHHKITLKGSGISRAEKSNNHQHNRQMAKIEGMPDLCAIFITLEADIHFKFPMICSSCLPALLQPRKNGKISG